MLNAQGLSSLSLLVLSLSIVLVELVRLTKCGLLVQSALLSPQSSVELFFHRNCKNYTYASWFNNENN